MTTIRRVLSYDRSDSPGAQATPPATTDVMSAPVARWSLSLHEHGTGPERVVDAVVGGGVALVFGLLLFPPEPVALVRDAERGVTNVRAATDRTIADAAIKPGDVGRTVQILLDATAVDLDSLLDGEPGGPAET
jgi:hypothetical protein